MYILIAFLALNLLIVVHELGHFCVAKLAKIKVHEFSMFMGPKIFSFEIGETTYSLRSLPIGGYVKLEGEDVSSEDERAFNKKPLYVKALVIAAGPVMNVILAMILFFSIYISYGYSGNVVGYVEAYSPAYESGIKEGDIIKSYGGRSTYTANDLLLFLHLDSGEKTNVVIERNGATQTVMLAPFKVPKERYILGFSMQASFGADSVKVLSVPAEGNQEFKANDKIVKLNDVSVKDRKDVMAFLEVNKDKEIDVSVERNNEIKVIKIKPVLSKERIDDYNLGFGFKGMKGNVLQTTKATFINTYSMIRYTGYSFYGLITGKISTQYMTGPVGLVADISTVVEDSLNIEETWSMKIKSFLYTLLNLTAVISIAIGITNLLPIPPMDGSKLLLIGIEGIRRKPLKQELEQAIAVVGVVLLIGLSIFVLFNDIIRLINERLLGG
jgi:regulator of sigma E protease